MKAFSLVLPAAFWSFASALGCAPSTCDAGSEDFNIDAPLAAEAVEAALEAQGRDPSRWDEAECVDICQEVYGSGRGWQANVDECEFELPEMNAPSNPGFIRCSGLGVEYYCK